jgi:LPS-assembly protein
MHLNNFFRQTGATMTQAEFKIPVEYTTSFFDDYLNLSLGEEIYYSKYFFGNQEYLYDQFQYSSTIHKVNLFTDLTKKYDTFVHVWQPFIEYTDPATENQLPVHFSQLSDDQQNLFSVGLPEQKYALGFNQYFYNDNAELKFYQRIKQDYYPKRLYQWANISNEMQYNWSKWSLYSSVIYANAFNTFRESTNSISLNEEAYRFTLGHTYKKILPDSTIGEVEANSVNVSTAYIVNKRVSLNAGFIYDLDNSANNQWNIGGDYHRDCWGIIASLRRGILPMAATYGSNYLIENQLFVQLNFTPFGSIATGDR